MKTEVFTIEQFKNLIYNGKCLPKKSYQESLENIRYFSYIDFNTVYMSNELEKSMRFIVTYCNKIIYGVAKIGIFDSNPENISLSYISVNVRFQNMKVSKIIIEKMFQIISSEFKGLPFSTSGYTPSGWKYLRKKFIEQTTKFGIEFIDKPVQYPDKGVDGELIYDDNYYELIQSSRKEINYCY